MSDQKEKTKEYWDKFYKEGASTNTAPQDTKVSDVDHPSKDLEWIVPNVLQFLIQP